MEEKNILIVEDELLVQLSIVEFLESLGYENCHTASSCEEALEVAEENQLDLALMDINIVGDRDGIDTAKLLKQNRDIPIIFLTAYCDDKILQRAKEIEPAGYLIKPIRFNELKATLTMVLHKEEIDRQVEEANSQMQNLMHPGKLNLDEL